MTYFISQRKLLTGGQCVRSKQQLLACIQLYHKVGVENSDTKDAAFGLVRGLAACRRLMRNVWAGVLIERLESF